MPALVPLLHMEYPQDEPYFLDHVPFRSYLYHLESLNTKLSVECENGKNFYLSQYGVVTKMFECALKASAVDSERLYMLIMILHSNFIYISSLEMSIMNTNLLVFGTKHHMCFTFIILCHFDTPKFDGVTAMFGSMLTSELVTLTFDAPTSNVFNLEVLPRELTCRPIYITLNSGNFSVNTPIITCKNNYDRCIHWKVTRV